MSMGFRRPEEVKTYFAEGDEFELLEDPAETVSKTARESFERRLGEIMSKLGSGAVATVEDSATAVHPQERVPLDVLAVDPRPTPKGYWDLPGMEGA